MRIENSKAWICRKSAELHRDDHGSMSVVTVFAVLVLTMLLGMVMNMGRQVDGKIRMQNAADAAAFSGGMVLARAMNDLAFTNHLLCESFAMTAWLSEARDQNAKQYMSDILNAWTSQGKALGQSSVTQPPFAALGSAILSKIPLEQQLVTDFCTWATATSTAQLPMFQAILGSPGQDGLIPQYQQAVIAAFPDLAATAATQIAQQNGAPDNGPGRGNMAAALWQPSTGNQVVGGTTNSFLPLMQTSNANYATTAAKQRRVVAHYYLDLWNSQTLGFFSFNSTYATATMCQFGNLWKKFSCGQLEQLLSDYPSTNLVQVIDNQLVDPNSPTDSANAVDPMATIRNEYMFLGVAYWQKLPAFAATIFANATKADSVAYAEVQLFVPKRKLRWTHPGTGTSPTNIGGMAGGGGIQGIGSYSSGTGVNPAPWIVARQPTGTYNDPVISLNGGDSIPTARDSWSLLSQGWTVKLVPAVAANLTKILQAPPSLSSGATFQLPTLYSTGDDTLLQQISPH
jgi:hypothetical protein